MIDFLEVKIRDIDKLRKFCNDFIECKNLKAKRIVPWYFTPETTTAKFPQMSHNMFGRTDKRPVSQFFNLFYEIVDKTFIDVNLDYKGCIRACLNMTYHIPGYPHFDPHVDNPIAHYSTILYLNESDGNTVIFDAENCPEEGEVFYSQGRKRNFTEPGMIDYDVIDWDNDPLPIKHECKPEFGKMLIFNGKYLHTMRPPSPGKLRIISVFNVAV